MNESVRSTTPSVIIIGTGFGGLCMAIQLRNAGIETFTLLEKASGVGGTWRDNTYPGAACDVQSHLYSFSFEPKHDWSRKFGLQPEILGYMQHCVEKYGLAKHIQVNKEVANAVFNEATNTWTVGTSAGESFTARYVVAALGLLAATNIPDIPGIDDFTGECYHTGRWPQEPVSFAGKRVGVIGTGSSGVQSIPEIAREAAHLTVFQRTPQYSIPARNRPLEPEMQQHARENWDEVRATMKAHPVGMPFEMTTRLGAEDGPEQRQALYEDLWQKGSFNLLFGSYADLLTNKETNRTLADFIRGKIRETVRDPKIAAKLMPDYYLGTKRQVLDDGYYETFNRDNVTLVDLHEDPIQEFTQTSVRIATGDHPLDMLVLATGFDAISGTLLRLNPKGRGGVSLKDKWRTRFDTYLGMAIADFPNLFLIHGPGSPSVLYNMPLGAERETEWIGNCVRYLRERGLGAIEPTPDAEKNWDREITELANETLYPLTDSWYTGANIPGKPRQFCVHLGGPLYFQRLSEVAAKGYEGFVFEEEHHAEVAAAS